MVETADSQRRRNKLFTQERFGDLVVKSGKDFQCQLCGYSAQKKSLLVYHLGTKHGKVCRILQRSENGNLFQVNDVLVEQGYMALPCPVARDTRKDPEIQKKIMELKKERQQDDAGMPPPRVSGCFVSVEKIGGSQKNSTSAAPHEQQSNDAQAINKQTNNHVSFGPEHVRFIPPRNNKF